MRKEANILFVGVGGQGTISASNLLSAALIELGYDVKMSEVHGMAQRGGSVSTQVRYGEKVYSPLIEKGTADYIMSFEKSESLRWIGFLKEEGKVISSLHEIRPYLVNVGKEVYPENSLSELKEKGIDVISLDAQGKAIALGNGKAANMILLGILAKELGLSQELLERLIKQYFKPQLQEVNLKALNEGYLYDETHSVSLTL
ncbi:indolepyruvate oxidoreductase subunit beta [Proteiniclasticum ruminis]|jgi:indolepyruvate ferredoxin oxidoreductase beta subunit|uniref:Indolepyruvate ferredoxin oxidoreductase beta subunit n=1 Tax=Proteiniclasticum ruminis TaxID=398199 RepID=A0A1G8N576_9CLOT|nr:indolepyruvate oxidoreductase subunit beta [Proteiniclasticum ruminis]SDI75354.1 indolepyruvate ferredoxin oxidoreductase beta subunit [Proteiniclasticum ruminis]